MAKISSNIWLGGIEQAKSLDFLQSNGITHVLNVADNVRDYFPDRFTYLRLEVKDWGEEPDISRVLPIAFDFVSSLKSENKYLIHCMHGMNRSATICLAILMNLRKISLLQAYLEVSSKRYLSIDHGFITQLQFLEKRLFPDLKVPSYPSNM